MWNRAEHWLNTDYGGIRVRLTHNNTRWCVSRAVQCNVTQTPDTHSHTPPCSSTLANEVVHVVAVVTTHRPMPAHVRACVHTHILRILNTHRHRHTHTHTHTHKHAHTHMQLFPVPHTEMLTFSETMRAGSIERLPGAYSVLRCFQLSLSVYYCHIYIEHQYINQIGLYKG